jgi:hypothetical protein
MRAVFFLILREYRPLRLLSVNTRRYFRIYRHCDHGFAEQI